MTLSVLRLAILDIVYIVSPCVISESIYKVCIVSLVYIKVELLACLTAFVDSVVHEMIEQRLLVISECISYVLVVCIVVIGIEYC